MQERASQHSSAVPGRTLLAAPAQPLLHVSS
jgi:hypothetical protein